MQRNVRPDLFLRQRQEKTAVKLQSLIRRIGTIEGIAAVEDYRDLYELSAKDLERLLLVLAEDTEYEKVVFDIGFFGDGSMELLKCMDKLFVPQPATRSQQCKCKSWEALLKKEGLEECLAKMQYVAVNLRQDLTKIKECIREDIIRCMNRERVVSDEEIKDMIQQRVLDLGHEMYFSVTQKQEMIQGIFNSLRKLDILQEILEQDDVTEIMVNGYQTIFIEKAGRLYRYPHSFSSQSKLEDVIQQIVSRMNRVVNEASPIVDVRLEDGSRVNVVLPPVAINGPILTIRKFPNQPITIQTLIEIGSVTREAAEFLKSLVIAGYNIFISGGTGSGKTTFLNALSCFIPETERLITVEDSAELQIQGIANLVRLEAREANLEGKNAVSIRDLLRSALRMRPDRIILGEVRDAAACELLTAIICTI